MNVDLSTIPWGGIAAVLNGVIMPAVVAAVAWCRRVDKRLTQIEAALHIETGPMPLFSRPRRKRAAKGSGGDTRPDIIV
ncbi:MAG: hypothetical protein EKK55_21775 [Rhodocyclaceae bacterium]|nr:MAG: hypothetical protein EKK55_21775 [Rhodocyclaceae bacterium]